ncbi:MAG TPA: hypothetical protein PK542_01040 [Treponemataceae bacterium]|nr:hypothetical protein [Treponemataceae bacterium]HPS43051.1 hypothetical protein [Treponemataceae bacterium]
MMPLTLIAVAGCSAVRSCAASSASGDARSPITLEGNAPARSSELPAEGAFSSALPGEIAGKRVVLVGHVEMRGNAPHEAAAFVPEDGSQAYAFSPDSREREARALQGHLVELTAALIDSETLCPLSWKIVN